jgi:hypothetical protein
MHHGAVADLAPSARTSRFFGCCVARPPLPITFCGAPLAIARAAPCARFHSCILISRLVLLRPRALADFQLPERLRFSPVFSTFCFVYDCLQETNFSILEYTNTYYV